MNTDTSNFSAFGNSHLGVFLVGFIMVIFIAFLSKFKNRLSDNFYKIFNRCLASLVPVFFVCHILYVVLFGNFHPGWDLAILQICGVVATSVALYLVTMKKVFFNLVYFWGLTAMLIAFNTPDLRADFPHPFFFMFWIPHLLILGMIFYILKFFPQKLGPKDVLQVIGLFVFYTLAIALPFSLIIKRFYGYANYAYTLELPKANFMEVVFSSWGLQNPPAYYLPVLAIASTCFSLWYFLRPVLLGKIDCK
jgi:hypothetical integral membrane protein (TIGR02206 family)